MAGGIGQPAYVGREAELARLAAALDARAERPGVLLAGEAGIGKTRLLREFAAGARAQGAIVVLGGCLESGAEGLPFAPFVEALGRLCEALGPGTDELVGPGGAELAALVPEFGPRPAGEPDRMRLFEAVRALFDRAPDPTLLILEDLHWADRSSLELLSYLVRRLRHGRTLVVGTFRGDEIGPAHPVAPILAALTESGRAERLGLESLGRHETAALVHALRPDAAPAEADTIAARSEGNPLFATELAAVPGTPEGALPPTLSDLLLARVSGLSESARAVTALLAMAGRPISAALLQAAWEGPTGALDAGLAAALDHGVLVAPPADGRITFRHDLLAAAFAASLQPLERLRLHARLARLLTEHPGLASPTTAGAAAEVARHWVAAERDPEALAASVGAALAAERVPAWTEAGTHYEIALARWDRVPDAVDRAGLDHPELLHRAAVAAYMARDGVRAVALERQAIAELDDRAEPARVGAAYAHLAHWLKQAALDQDARLSEADEAGERAVALVPADPPAPERALALAALAFARMSTSRSAEGAALAREAAAVGAASGATGAEMRARGVLVVSLSCLGREEEALVEGGRAVELADACADGVAAVAAYADQIHALVWGVSERELLERALAAFGAAAERLDLSETGRTFVQVYTVTLHYLTGAWDAVEAETAAILASRPLDAETLATRGAARIQRGRLDDGEGDMRKVLATFEGTGVGSLARAQEWLAQAALLRGHPDRALDLVAEAGALLDATQNALLRTELAALGLRAAADLAEVSRARRDSAALERAEAAGTRYRAALDAALTGTLVPDMGVGPTIRALGAWGLAEAGRLAGASDPAAWADAAAQLQPWREPLLPSYARFRQAEANLARGERGPGGAALRAAHLGAQALRAAPVLADITALAHRARVELAAPEAPASALSAAIPHDPYRLSPRERDVLALLVEGHTNREIGAALFISEKTASVHVTHILDKLGVVGRVAAAGVAVRAGLVPIESQRD